MSSMLKFHVGLLIVICTVELMDASCLSYGHSCWGAHGKRSYPPQRELNPGEPSDRWAIFKFMPERNEVVQFKKLLRGNLPMQSDNDLKNINSPFVQHQISSDEESNLNEDKDLNRNIEALAQENEDFLQRQQQAQRMPMMKPFLRLNKPNFEQ